MDKRSEDSERVLFSRRLRLAAMAEAWCQGHNIPPTPDNVLAALDALGALKEPEDGFPPEPEKPPRDTGQPYLDRLFNAAVECTGEDHPDMWEWRGRQHLMKRCNCGRD